MALAVQPLVIAIPPPTSLEDFTISIEQACKLLSKQPAATAVLKFASSEADDLPAQPSDFSFAGLQRWEKALALLQQQAQLVVALLDGPVYDLSLSVALACDIRLCTSRTFLPPPSGELHEPLPLWWLASLALHVGALPAQQMLYRRAAVTSAELVASGAVWEAADDASALLKVVGKLPLAPNVPIQLLRRIVLQGFSIEGSDIIGHALAVNSLVITDAMERVSLTRGTRTRAAAALPCASVGRCDSSCWERPLARRRDGPAGVMASPA